MRKQILELLNTLTKAEAITLIESIGKELRQKNSIRISSKKFKQMVDERPDEAALKQ